MNVFTEDLMELREGYIQDVPSTTCNCSFLGRVSSHLFHVYFRGRLGSRSWRLVIIPDIFAPSHSHLFPWIFSFSWIEDSIEMMMVIEPTDGQKHSIRHWRTTKSHSKTWRPVHESAEHGFNLPKDWHSRQFMRCWEVHRRLSSLFVGSRRWSRYFPS